MSLKQTYTIMRRIRVLLILGTLWMSGCHHGESEPLKTAGQASPQTRMMKTEVEMSFQKVRPATLAGRWYEGDAAQLRTNIENWIGSSDASLSRPQAIVAPHAGHVWSGDIAGKAWRSARNQGFKRIFILCPNHRMPVSGIVADDSDAFDTPLGAIPVDTATRDALIETGLVRLAPAAHKNEHAIEIQLPFMKVVAPEATLVPLIVGQISDGVAKKFASKLRTMLTQDDLIVISSDFVHYGEAYDFVPFTTDIEANIEKYDAKTVEAISWLDGDKFSEFARENDHTACGINALRIMAYLFEKTGATAKQLDYSMSGRKTGEFDMSVSYVALMVSGANMDQLHDVQSLSSSDQTSKPVIVLDELSQSKAHAIIRMAVQEAVHAGHETPFVPENIEAQIGVLPKIFDKQYGVFVTLHEDGMLRGCIGNILPYQNLKLSLWGRAQDAALNDPRFDPVIPEELPKLHYEISILTPPEPVSGPSEIVIGRHGVILQKNGRQAIFLPQVAPEQGWNIEQTLTALSLKAGLKRDDWREGATFSVIEAQVF